MKTNLRGWPAFLTAIVVWIYACSSNWDYPSTSEAAIFLMAMAAFLSVRASPPPREAQRTVLTSHEDLMQRYGGARKCDQCGIVQADWQDADAWACPNSANPRGSCDGVLVPKIPQDPGRTHFVDCHALCGPQGGDAFGNVNHVKDCPHSSPDPKGEKS